MRGNRPYGYVLDEQGRPVPSTGFDDPRLLALFEPADPEHAPRRVAVSQIGEYHVSTVFLVYDHAFYGGPPVLWETMVFGPGPWSEWQTRYTSREAAETGHKRVVEALLRGDGPDTLDL